MRHALGVQSYDGKRWKKPYRNHFVAGLDDAVVWDELVTKGFAVKNEGGILTGGDPVYYVTDLGKEAALAGIIYKKKWGYGTPTNGGT
jgi:hypothetical protein